MMAAQGIAVPEDYVKNFVKVPSFAFKRKTTHPHPPHSSASLQAENTFLHQTVWNPLTELQEPVTPWPTSVTEPELHTYVGP